LLRRELCATELRYKVGHPEGRINELSRHPQIGIESADKEGSQQGAGNEPRAIQISPNPPEPPCGPFSDRFLFQVSDFEEQVDGSRALPAPTRISPAPTTEQKHQ